MKKKNSMILIGIIISFVSLMLSARISRQKLVQQPVQQQVIKQHAAQEQAQAAATLTEATDSNEHLIAILKNAQILAEQIRTKTFDYHEGQNAARLIVDAEKKLSPDIHASVKEHISSLIHEYTLYSKTPGLKRKTYDKTKAEAALQSLANIIKHTTSNTAESVVSQASNIVQDAITDTEKTIKKAQLIINETEKKAEEGTISPAKAARIIGQQQRIILTAEKTLQQTAITAQEVVMQSDEQTGYVSWLANGAYNVAQSVIAPFKAGYGYSDEEKETARSIITQLKQQETKLIRQHQTAMMQPALAQKQKDALTKQYHASIKDLQNELYEQQIITGDAMSLSRKLFWGTVAAATAGIGYYYFTTPSIPSEEGKKLLAEPQDRAVKHLSQKTRSLVAKTLEQPIKKQQENILKTAAQEITTKVNTQEILQKEEAEKLLPQQQDLAVNELEKESSLQQNAAQTDDKKDEESWLYRMIKPYLPESTPKTLENIEENDKEANVSSLTNEELKETLSQQQYIAAKEAAKKELEEEEQEAIKRKMRREKLAEQREIREAKKREKKNK